MHSHILEQQHELGEYSVSERRATLVDTVWVMAVGARRTELSQGDMHDCP